MKVISIVPAVMAAMAAFGQNQGSSLLGKVDFNAILGAAPVLKPSPEAAFEYVCHKDIHCQGESPLEADYKNFKKKMELYANQLTAAFDARAQAFQDAAGDGGLLAKSKASANQNDIVSQMGGVDRIQKMSEQERERAARQAAASNAASSGFSPFTEAEMQRMMRDPAYAQEMASKYEQMTDKQKADLVQQRLSEGASDVSHEEFESRMKGKQNARDLMFINSFIAEANGRLANALSHYETERKQVRNASGSHAELDRKYEEGYQKIPLVIMWEGKVPDPQKAADLKREYALKHRNRAAMELSESQQQNKVLLSVAQSVIADYHEFLRKNEYRISGDMDGVYNGTNSELALAQLELAIADFIGKIGEISYSENSLASGHEMNYQSVLNE